MVWGQHEDKTCNKKILITTAILAYGGISVFVIMFTMYPIFMAAKKGEHFNVVAGDKIADFNDEEQLKNLPPVWKAFLPIVVFIIGAFVLMRFLTPSNYAVVTASPTFTKITDWVLGLHMSPILLACVGINVICAITGSASGGITIFWNTLANCMRLDCVKKYVGGSPANTAVGLSRLGRKCGFLGAVSDDRFGDYVTEYFENEGIDTSHVVRCKNGESLGLTFTEILSKDESSILMYRNGIAVYYSLSLNSNSLFFTYVKI